MIVITIIFLSINGLCIPTRYRWLVFSNRQL